MRSIVIAVTLICLFRGVALAGDPLLEAIKITKQASPDLSDELKTLVGASDRAKAFLAKREDRPADPLATSHSRQFLAYCALEITGWSLSRCKYEYPELCKGAELLATARDEKGRHWAIYRFSSNGELGLGSLYNAGEFHAAPDAFELPIDASWCDYDTALDHRGDILLVRYEARGSADDKFRKVVTEHLIIHEGKLTRLKRVTEEFPIENL